MQEENKALQSAYNIAKSKGYTKSINDFSSLLSTNQDALNNIYSEVQSKGYKKSLDEFSELLGVKKKDISASSIPQQSLESNSGNGSSVSQNNKVINQSNSKITKLAQDTESAKVVSNEKIKEITQSVDDEINQVGIINNTKAYAKKGFNKLIDGLLTITPLHDSERVAFKNRFGLEENPLSDELKEIKKEEQDEIALAKRENRPARTLTNEERMSKARQLKIDKRIKSESDSQVRAFMKDAEKNIDEYGVSDKDKLLIYNKSKEQSISYKDKDLLKRADLFSKVVLNTENEIKEVRDSFRNGEITKDEAQSKLDFLNKRRNNSIAEGIRNLEEFNSKDDELGTVKDNIDLLKRNYNWITNITRSVDAGVDKMASGIIDSGRWLNEIVGQDQYSADNIMFMSMSNDLKKSYQAKTESLMKPISVDDIDFDSEHLLSDFGSYASTLLGQQLPIMAAVVTGAPGISALGFSSAGEKYDEMIMEEAKGEENYSHTQKIFAPLGYGLSETGSALVDRMIMMNTSRVIRAATSLEKKEIAKGFAKNVFIKPTLHTLKSTAIEGLEEGATEIAQNLIDIYFLDKKDVDVYDNVKDAVVAGGLMGGAMSSPALVFSPYGSIRNSIERFSTEQNLRQAQNIVFKLSEALNSDNISETEFGIIKDQFDKATIKTIDIAKTEASKIAQLSNDEFNAINEIERGKKEIKSKAQEILDGELSQELKDEVLKGLKDEYTTLENQRVGILNRDSNALLNLLPQEEVIRLKDEAGRELMQEKNPDGTKNITIEDKEISERALENHRKQSLPNETTQTEDIVDDGNTRPSNEQLDSVQGELENGKKGDNQTQEIQSAETVERSKVIKASDNGREYTISNEEGRIVFKDRQGNLPSKRTYNRLSLEYAKQTDLTEGKRAHEVEGVTDSSELANMTVKEANKFIAEKSESPIEIAETILGNEIEDYRNGVDYKQKVIAENIGHVSRESFIQNSDEVHAKEGGSIPIQYLRKDGTPLDTKAKELSEIAGIEISEQDIVDFILDNPTGPQTFLNNGFHSDVNALKARLEELTGLPATNEVIQEIVNQNERKLQLQEQMTSIDFMSEQELLHLLNQREQYEQETANASTKGVREIADSKNNEGKSRVQQDGARENQGTESPRSREAEEQRERVNLPKSTFNKLVQTFQKFFGAGNVHSDSNKLAKVLGQDPNSVFFQKQWEGINDTFNSELEQLQKGTLPKGHVFQLGSPTRILQAAGIPNLPIELAASRLRNKSKQDNHPFELSEIKNLAIAVQNPLAVFRSATRLDSNVIMTELEHKGNNFVVALETNKSKGKIEINDIRSVYPKNNKQVANWIDEGLLDYADKQKMSEWFSKQRSNYAEVRNLFRHAANLVQKFENPKVNDVDFQVNYKKLASDNKYTQPKVPTQNIFFNDVEVLNRETENMVGKLVDEGKNVSVQSVDVVNIIPTQKNVNINNLKEVQDVRERPLLFKQGDKYYVIDGHHRISNEILEGEKKVEADVYDADIQFMQTPDGTIWGATYLNEQGQREIYINESALSPETLLHEVYHPFDDMMKQASENGDVHALVAIGRLDKLAKENGYLEAVQSNPNYANKPLEQQQQAEARVQMIGEIGNKQLDKSFYEKLETAVIDAIEWLAKQFGVSLKNYSPEQIINLKLGDIVKASLASAQKGEFDMNKKQNGINQRPDVQASGITSENDFGASPSVANIQNNTTEQFSTYNREKGLITERIKPERRRTVSSPKKLNEIIDDVRKSLKATLIYGKTGRSNGLGSYNPSSTLVRIRKAGDLDTVAHELGHWLDDKYQILDNIPDSNIKSFKKEIDWFSDRGGSNPPSHLDLKKKERYLEREGIGEFIRAYVANPSETKIIAPNLLSHLENIVDKKDLAVLKAFSNDYLDFYNATAGEKILANIETSTLPNRTKATEWLKKFKSEDGEFTVTPWDKLNDNLFNALGIANKAFEFATNLSKDDYLTPDKNFEMLSRVFSGIDGKTEIILRDGLIDGKNEFLKDKDGNNMTINWLLDPLDNSSENIIKQEMNEIIQYLVAERTVEYAKKFNRTDNLTGIGAGIETDISIAVEHLNNFKEFKTTNKEKYNRIKEAANRYRQYADAGLKYAVDKGRITKEEYDIIKENNEYYVALSRIKENAPMDEDLSFITKMTGNLTSVKDVVKKAKGGTDFIQNPYISLLQNTVALIKESDRNEVLRSFVNPLSEIREMGDGTPLDFSQIARIAQQGDKNTKSIYINGVKQIWQFSPDVYKSLTGLEKIQTNSAIKIFKAPADLLRFTVTHFPVFAAKNLTRDTTSRLVVTRTNSGFKNMISSYSDFQLYSLYGGSQAGFYLSDKNAYKNELNSSIKKMASKGGIVLDPRNIWKGYKKILEKGENVNRIAEFKSAYSQALKQGLDSYNASLYAAYQARDLMDFAVAGHWIRYANMFIPFLNAGVQGVVRTKKSMTENPGSFIFRTMLYTVLPTILSRILVSLNGDDDEYEELPDYQRDLAWNFKTPFTGDTWISIPKPFEQGLFSSFVDRGISLTKGNDDAFDGFAGSSLNVLVPVDGASIAGPFKPIVEVMTNKDMFRDKYIVSPFEEGKMLELRKGADKSSRVGLGTSKVFNSVGMTIDPRHVDHLIKSYTSYMGDWGLSISDIGKEDSRYTFGISKTGFAKDIPVSNAKSVTKAYELARELGVQSTKKVKKLRNKIESFYDAEDTSERKKISEEIYSYSKDLIKDFEEKKKTIKNPRS